MSPYVSHAKIGMELRLIVQEYIATINDRLEVYTLKWSFVIDFLSPPLMPVFPCFSF